MVIFHSYVSLTEGTTNVQQLSEKTQTPFCEAKLISTSQTFSFRPSKSFRTDMFTASVNLTVEPVAGNHHESP